MASSPYTDPNHNWGDEPSKVASRIPNYVSPPAKVIDLGVGQGRNSLPLAELGYQVTGVDSDNLAIKEFKKRAQENGLNVTGIVADMSEVDLRGYDVYLSVSAIHYLPKEKARATVKRIMDATAVGGLNVILVFTKHDQTLKDGWYGFEVGELQEFYKNPSWELLEQTPGSWGPEHKHSPTGRLHKHHRSSVIAKKVA